MCMRIEREGIVECEKFLALHSPRWLVQICREVLIVRIKLKFESRFHGYSTTAVQTFIPYLYGILERQYGSSRTAGIMNLVFVFIDFHEWLREAFISLILVLRLH